MGKVKRFLWLILVLGLALFVAGNCTAAIGACAGYSTIFSKTYCYNDWSQADCDEYNTLEVNGASWAFYPDQTCGDLGYQAYN